MTEAAGAKGFEACRVEDVLERSGLSRSVFYAHFKDKTECFMAAFEVAVDGLLAVAAEAVENVAEPGWRLEAGLYVVLEKLDEDPAMARLALVEIHTAGSEGRRRFAAAGKRFAALLVKRGCIPVLPSGLETEAAEQAVGTVTTVLWLEIGAGRPKELRRLVPALVAGIMWMSAPARELRPRQGAKDQARRAGTASPAPRRDR